MCTVAMVPSSMQLSGGPWAPGGANVLSLDGGGPFQPPSPGAPSQGGAFASKDAGQIQQKMARQRQLALERRRMAGRMTAGGMAQANQLPAPAATLPTKAPGWDRVLGEGIEKPGSFAEKAQAAFDGTQSTTIVKAGTQLTSVNENAEQRGVDSQQNSARSASNTLLEEKQMPKPLATQGTIEEVDLDMAISDVLDIELPTLDSRSQKLPGRIHRQESPGGFQQPTNNLEAAKMGDGWGLQVEDSMSGAGMLAGAQAQDQAGGRRWYKPSTWNKPNQEKSNKGARNSATVEVTAVSALSSDIQRLGARTPDSNEMNGPGPQFSSPGRRRPRKMGTSPRPAPQNTAMGMDFDFMGCPGAINDAPPPMPVPLTSKAQSNPKHHGTSVERAAFPQEERAAQKAKEESVVKGKLAELEAKKKAAIAAEDFLEAQRIKGEIEAFLAQEKAPARAAPSPAPVNAVQSFSTPPPTSAAQAATLSALAPSCSRNAPSNDDVVEAMLNDQYSDFGDKPHQNLRPREGRPRPAADASSWNLQVDEAPKAAAPSVSDEPVRKRFWKPWSGAAKPSAAPGPAPTQDTTMVSAFDSS